VIEKTSLELNLKKIAKEQIILTKDILLHEELIGKY
jgi:hypothetical protein